LLRHIQVLSSDAFEGRAPGTKGETLTTEYLISQFKSAGLRPGNPDGSYVQQVPLAGIRADHPSVEFASAAGRIDLSFPAETVVWSKQPSPEVAIANSDVVFVGYGVVAPEYDWDDYKGADLRGKTLLMLINDPPIPDPHDPSKLDERLFKGRTMTYYGRWTYKFEMAAAKGAAAAIIVHETAPAAYPWAVVEGSNSRENFDLASSGDKHPPHAPVEGWVTLESAQRLCAAAGHDYEELKKAALRRDFRPLPLSLQAAFHINNIQRNIASTNVVARIEGSDPALKNEYVIYTAHWDHLGTDARLRGDQIYNGAVDNATGCAALLEIARAFRDLRPRRSILFAAVTAEEKGLLGAKYYATHPLYPLRDTVANINMDALNVWGRTKDVEVIGAGQSTLEDILRTIAEKQGRRIVPDAQPEKGSYFRSDHFEFARQGVPALDAKSGLEIIGKPAGFGLEKRQEFVGRDYHKPSDEIKAGWDFSGLAEDAEMLLRVGLEVANAKDRPEWKTGSEFKRQAGEPSTQKSSRER
jgi:Zn-dependent M28 family amino/carboxypeptidase